MLVNYLNEDKIEAGCDEAGRGCYAGAVFAAAVILPKKFYHPLLNDSKQVTAANRSILRTYIEDNAIAFSVAQVSVETIDKINILNAAILAMHQAVETLTIEPNFLAIDGNKFKPYKNIGHQCVIKGDAKYAHIAAASILAKTYRDDYMQQLHKEFCMYGWDKNKGYGTAVHRKAIELHGICHYHRKSFNILPKQLNLF